MGQKEFEFTGVVEEVRPIYVPTDGCMQYTIILDKPMRVYGTEKSSVLMHTLPDGQASSYTGGSDWMEKT